MKQIIGDASRTINRATIGNLGNRFASKTGHLQTFPDIAWSLRKFIKVKGHSQYPRALRAFDA